MENKVELYKLRAALDEFQKIDPDLTVSDVLTFLHAAEAEGLSVKDVQERMHFSQSTASRTVNKLGQHGTRTKAGLSLLQTEENPGERRKVSVRLSVRGRKLARLLAGMVSVFALIDPDGPAEGPLSIFDPTTPAIISSAPTVALLNYRKVDESRTLSTKDVG